MKRYIKLFWAGLLVKKYGASLLPRLVSVQDRLWVWIYHQWERTTDKVGLKLPALLCASNQICKYG